MRVPTYQRTQQAAVVRQPKAQAGNIYQSLSRAGFEVQNIGSLLAQRQQIRNYADATNALNAYAEEAITVKTELEKKKGVEARVISDNYKEWHNDAVARIGEKYLHNEDARALFSSRANQHYRSKIGTLAKYQANQEAEYNQSVLNRQLQNIDAIITDDPYASIETDQGELLAVDVMADEYHRNAMLLLGGAYTQDVAGDIEAKIKSNALASMIARDPSRAAPYIEKYKLDIGSKAYAQFKDTTKKEIIKKQSDLVYDAARAMSIENAEDYINNSGLPRENRRQILANIRQDYDREQKEIADQQEKVVKQNNLDVLEAFYNKTLKKGYLDTLANGKQISEGIYRFINEKLVNQAEDAAEGYNNPEIIGQIAKMIEYKAYDRAENELREALTAGNVKGDTYISMIRNIAKDETADATGYINRAIQPGEFDFDPEPKQRWADAIRDLNMRTRSGEDPMEVALSIIELNERIESQGLSGFRKPRYLKGKKDDLAALDDAVNTTVEAYHSGIISDEEYKREMDLIEDIKASIGRVTQIQDSKSELKDVLKGLKVGR